jgi:hypothetical protein
MPFCRPDGILREERDWKCLAAYGLRCLGIGSGAIGSPICRALRLVAFRYPLR